MEEVRETLRTHSRYIRDTLLPLVTDQKGSKLNSRDIYCLRTALYEVNAIPITLDLLRYSRIEKALVFIAMDPRWPAEATSRAAKILTKWEKSFGPVDDLRADLWGPGGRLEGLKKMKGPRGATAEKAENASSSWSIRSGYDLSKPYQGGHLGFAVGAWWIKSIAAVRDGIVASNSSGVTVDQDGVYAMILKDGEERPIENGMTRYATSAVNFEVLQLSKPMIGDRRTLIRILRSCKLHSPLAPTAGLRYDGLYRVVSYGIKLTKDKMDHDVWTYGFTLQRECAQASIKEALCHPTADELDDFLDYHRAKAAGDVPTIRRSLSLDDDESSESASASALALTVGDGVERHMSNDSGYQSMSGFRLSDGGLQQLKNGSTFAGGREHANKIDEEA